MHITIQHTVDPLNIAITAVSVMTALYLCGAIVWPASEMVERRVVRVWEWFKLKMGTDK